MNEDVEFGSIQSCSLDFSEVARSEADAQLRQHRQLQEMDLRAASMQQAQREQRKADKQSEELENLRAGPLGLGDQHHPINQKLFAAFYTSHQAVVANCSAAWRREHGGMGDDGSIWGEPAARVQCSASFCKARDTAGLTPNVFQSLRGFLMNVTRLLRQRARTQKGIITAASRHFLFFIRVGERCKGWLVTNPHYKPLNFEGVAVDVPSRLDTPFSVNITMQAVQSCGAQKDHFRFVTLNEVAKDLALMVQDGQYDPEQWEWCHAPYKLFTNTPLSVLHITEALNWVPMARAVGPAAGDDEDNDGPNSDGQDDDGYGDSNLLDASAELGEICEMTEAMMTSFGQRKPPQARSKAQAKPKASGSGSSLVPLFWQYFSWALMELVLGWLFQSFKFRS